jgi:phospholipid transport system substrate-binding protein
VLGRYWAQATPGEQQEFMRLYEDYVVFGYSARLGALGGQLFKVTGTRAAGSGVTVVSEVRGKDDPTGTEIDWRVIPAGAGWKVTDVVIDGISMNETQRSEFAAVLQRNAGELQRLFALMREKNASMAQ